METAGTDRFDGYSAELNLVTADLTQKLDTLPTASADDRKTLNTQCDGLLDDAAELITSLRMEKSSVPQASKTKIAQRLRDHESDVDTLKRRLASLNSDKAKLFGGRYRDDPAVGDEALEQRQQLLSGTDRLNRSSGRLRESQRIANETEQIGAGTLADLAQQRTQLEGTRERLLESEGYTDRSIKTLRGMARRMATNRLITIAIITILVILIIAVIVSKFR